MQMAPAGSLQALNALKPNIVPQPVGLWPMAAGWWGVAILSLALVGGVVWLLWRRFRRRRYRRIGRKQLSSVWSRFERHKQIETLLHECNHLLKMTALQAFPRQQIAQLNGQRWIAFLVSTLPNSKQRISFNETITSTLKAGLYKKEARAINPHSLRQAIDLWIRKHHV